MYLLGSDTVPFLLLGAVGSARRDTYVPDIQGLSLSPRL